MKKLKVILILLTLLWVNWALARNIDLTGKWIWVNPPSQLNENKVILQQNNISVIGKYDTSNCGIVNIAGFIQDDNDVGINMNFETDSNDCPAWTQIVASCNNDDCSVVNGTWRDSNHLTGTLTWVKENQDFYISFPKQNSEFIIDTSPKMPPLQFIVTSSYPNAPLKWTLNMSFRWSKGNTDIALSPVTTNTNEYIPDMTTLDVTGGEVTTTAIYNPTENNQKVAVGNYKIYGKNPGKTLIQKEITDPLQLKIACVESVFRQFEGKQEGGEGLPLIGKNSHGKRIGGVGIMQVLNKPVITKTVWNWRENLKNGLFILNQKRALSKKLHLYERKRLNADRKKRGLPHCPKNIPTPLTEEQLIRDSIRRYNYGVEYRWEPRYGENCAGQWVLSPSCVRNPNSGCDRDYVNKVLTCEIT